MHVKSTQSSIVGLICSNVYVNKYDIINIKDKTENENCYKDGCVRCEQWCEQELDEADSALITKWGPNQKQYAGSTKRRSFYQFATPSARPA